MAKKYQLKELVGDDVTGEAKLELERRAVTARQVKKPETIETEFGDALITSGNYVLTDMFGNKIGITADDFERRYINWKK